MSCNELSHHSNLSSQLNFNLYNFRGYFPKGRGEVLVSVSPVRSLKGVTLTDFGEVKRVFGFSFVSGKFPSHVRILN